MFEDFAAEHHRAATAYDRQESRKKRLLALVRLGRETTSAFGAEPRGEFKGLALDVRPAVGFGGDRIKETNLRALKQGLKTIRGLELVGQFIVNEQEVARRVFAEPKLAKMVGWDARQTVSDNVRRASIRHDATREAQALAGFLLGFPESAIRYWMQRAQKGKDQLTAQRVVQIKSPDGDIVFHFVVDGEAGEHAPDVEALRERVARAFREAGF